MKQKKVETLLYSSLGVVVMFAIIVAVNLISGAFKSRLDLTEGNIYTLSPGTKAILKRVDSPMEARFYFSQSEERLPSWAATYARQVEDLLSEFREASGGNIEIKKLDPQPDSDAEDLANLDGIEPQLNPQTGERFYFGLALSYDPQKVAVPLAPDRERLLEYDLARAVAQVITTNKPVVGVMSPLPVHGQPSNPMMMRMGQQGQEPWVILGELKRDFDVRKVEMDADHIEDAIQVLVVIHPKEIKDSAQYAIDQFVLRGGKLIAFLDPMALTDANRQNPMMPMPGAPSNLDKLLKAWGVTFDNTKVVADMDYARELRTQQGGAQLVPTYLFVTGDGINKDDIVCNQVDEILMPFAGTFSGTPATGLKQTVLLRSTKRSQLVEGFMAQMNPQKTVDDFKASETVYNLAIRLEGKFKTAFPDGKPDAPKPEGDDKDKKSEAKTESLKESKSDNAVVIFGDSDIIHDSFSLRVQNFLGMKIVQPLNGNLTLAQNLIEQFAGDQNLIGARSRATLKRPFTVIQQLQAEANQAYQAQIATLQKELDETNQRLGELQVKKEPGQRAVLSTEQQQEIERFRQKKAQANAKLKLLRRSLREEIDWRENVIKWTNIAGMALLVSATGIVLAVVRKQKTKAQ
jgi:ABC-type uncharacterized transport system involved in gliding motility auxiliary subunit